MHKKPSVENDSKCDTRGISPLFLLVIFSEKNYFCYKITFRNFSSSFKNRKRYFKQCNGITLYS